MKNLYPEKCKSHTLTSFNVISLYVFLILFSLKSIIVSNAQEYTRGVGVYPGNVIEDFSPVMHVDKDNYRNLALKRPVYHSSSYDYNLTAQLITDGIIDYRSPEYITVSSSRQSRLNKNERSWIMDRHFMTSVTLEDSKVWIQLNTGYGKNLPVVDSISIIGSMLVNDQEAKGWDYTISGSDDGKSWVQLGHAHGDGHPGDTLPRRFRGIPPNFRIFNFPVSLSRPLAYQFYRVDLGSPNVYSWGIGEVGLIYNKKRVEVGGPYHFSSSWMSGGNREEWVYVDLGAACSFDSIALHWIRRAAEGYIQISDDADSWKNIISLSGDSGLTEKFSFDHYISGRYVRILMKQPVSDESYILSEIEVFGRGGPVAVPKPQPEVNDNGRMDIAGGAWKVQRESLVTADGETLSEKGFSDNDWVVATVPATVLVSYLNAGTLPDPNFGDNQLMISESFFYSDFWYRTEFIAPPSYAGKRIYLNFDGINWKARVFLNGHFLGRIDGAFIRGNFDVSEILIAGQKNALAVLIEKNATPGYVTEQTLMSPDRNGGELGADNPTFHASVGWDWIPTIRGRNTGIWNDVYFTVSGPVTINDPFITSSLPLPDTSTAGISIGLLLRNYNTSEVEGTLQVKFGSISVEQQVTLEASAVKKVRLDPSAYPALRIQDPRLWWPAGYGNQNMYDVELKFVTKENIVSDIKSFRTGIRQLTYSEDGGTLKIWINGRRFVGRGGNWGFSESMLRYRAREYDIATRYHKDMNFTIIRNWVGQTADEEFYEACDRNGIMIWQDFWLANPVDGPNPDDNEMFMRNVKDMVLRIRNHPSIVLYCGRNEGNPPEELDKRIRQILPDIHPGIHYISHSSEGPVSGYGPYRAMPLKYYFEERATEKLHSEMGMPNIVTAESLEMMMPDSAMWPQGRMWGLHDFCLYGAQGGNFFRERLEKSFGKADNANEWVSLAQWINYEGYRAMFEAQSRNRMGLIIWMSHPAWPSMVWQTYDYYFEPTAAYFGCKKASEPLHIQWNPLSDSIEVVNYSTKDGSGLTAIAEVINMDGKVVSAKKVSLDCHEDSMIPCTGIEYPPDLTSVYFLRLKLLKGDDTLSENFYWRGLEEGNYRDLMNIPEIRLESESLIEMKNNRWYIETRLMNSSKYPALMVRLKVVREKSRDRILPVLYSDNYISLMPGEHRTIYMEMEHADTRGEKPQIEISGFNTEANQY